MTEEDVFEMQNMFSINKSSFESSMGSLPEDYPKGSIIELTSIDAETSEKTQMRVVEVVTDADIVYTISDYPTIGTAEEEE